MKHARKLASLLLALVMVFALATTAFAAGSGSITVDNPITSQTYTAYKIFDVTYSGDNYSYTIDSGSAWFGTVQTYASKTGSGLTLTQVNGSTTYNVTTTNAFSAPDFAAALKAAVSGKNGTELAKQADGTASVSNLPLGYYFVTSTSGALCNLTTTNSTVTIHDKNDMPFEKVDDKDSADVGQTVNYTITGKVPDHTGFATYIYKITDTMSEGLTFKKDVAVKIGDTQIDASTVDTWIAYTPSTGAATGFELTIPVKSYTIGAEIEVTYSAVVNEKAVAKIENNTATLKYTNGPSTDSFGTIMTEPVPVYSSKIVIDKYETDKENTKLAGAKFVLYKEVTTGEGEAAVTSKLYYKWNATDKKVEWVENKSEATEQTTDNNGEASFNGLADGKYYLLETAAPAGYNLLTEPVEVTVNGSSATTENKTSLSVTAEVANSTGTLLPSTGGMGTTIFYVLGSILAVGAIVLLVTKKRMSAAD